MTTHLEDHIRHERTVANAFHKLQGVGRYRSIQKHVPYRTLGKNGECDIIATSDLFINYYECKGHYCKQSYKHAIDQFKRYKESHPLLKVRFIYVSPEHTRRIYL